MLKAEALAGPAEGEGFVARAVVGHHPFDLHAQAFVVGDRRLEEGHGTTLPLILHHLAEGNTGGIVDADVHELPADTPAFAAAHATAAALSGPIVCDAMAYAVELAEFFDVDVDQFARMFAFIAPYRLSRFQVAYPV